MIAASFNAKSCDKPRTVVRAFAQPDCLGHVWKPVTMHKGMMGWGATRLLSECRRCKCTRQTGPLTDAEEACLKADGIGNGAGMPPCDCPDGREELPCAKAKMREMRKVGRVR